MKLRCCRLCLPGGSEFSAVCGRVHINYHFHNQAFKTMHWVCALCPTHHWDHFPTLNWHIIAAQSDPSSSGPYSFTVIIFLFEYCLAAPKCNCNGQHMEGQKDWYIWTHAHSKGRLSRRQNPLLQDECATSIIMPTGATINQMYLNYMMMKKTHSNANLAPVPLSKQNVGRWHWTTAHFN